MNTHRWRDESKVLVFTFILTLIKRELGMMFSGYTGVSS